eukprot:1855450-Pleurochrysis_carterae.AAC.1
MGPRCQVSGETGAVGGQSSSADAAGRAASGGEALAGGGWGRDGRAGGVSDGEAPSGEGGVTGGAGRRRREGASWRSHRPSRRDPSHASWAARARRPARARGKGELSCPWLHLFGACEKRASGGCDSCRVEEARPPAERAPPPTDLVARVKQACSPAMRALLMQGAGDGGGWPPSALGCAERGA